MRKVLFFIFIIPLLVACTAEVDISVSKSTGGPLGGATVEATEGGSTKASTATDAGGSLKMDLDYGKYKLIVTKDPVTKIVDGVTKITTYTESSSTVDVNFLGLFFGIDVSIPVAISVTEE